VVASRWTDALLDELSHQGDPEADAVIAAHVEATAVEPRQLLSNLARHLHLPPEQRSPPVEAYLAEQPPWPAWVDPVKLHRSADFFDQNGLLIGTALFCASLPEAYAGARGARVLTLTARLVTDTVRRVYETAQMLVDSMSRDGLVPGTGAGYEDVRRVRLMHAAVRHLILDDPEVTKTQTPEPLPSWCVTAGLPLNQEDMLGALMTFTQTVFESLDLLGAVYTPDEADAYLHAWCVVGHLIGIRADLLPLTLDDARELTTAIRRRQYTPSEDGEQLAEALVNAMRSSIRWRVLRPLPAALVRRLVGPDVAADIGLGRRGAFGVLFDGTARLMRVVGLAERRNKMLRVISRHFAAGILDAFVRAGREGNRPPFSLPTQLAAQVSDAKPRWTI